MPIVVDWSPVASLGSLAVDAGTSVGRQRGQLTHLRRQDEASAQAAQINQRNRELNFQQRWAPINDYRQAGIQSALQNQQFNQQSALLGQREEADYAQQLAKIEAQQQQPFLRRQAADQSALQRTQQQELQTAESLRGLGLSEEEIATELNRYRVMQAQRAAGGNLAVKGGGMVGTAATAPKRPTGELRGLGFDAARSGGLQSLLDPRTVSDLAMTGSVPRPDIQVLTELAAGAAEYWASESTPIEEVQRVMSDPNMPPAVRMEAARILTARGDVKYGANQRRPTNPAVRQMSDDELWRLVR